MKIAAFDIESTSLDATYGRIITACFKFADQKKVVSYTSRFLRNEPALLTGIKEQWNKSDVVLTWNGKLFDIPMVNARLMYHGMDILDMKKMHCDLIYMSKKLRFRGNRLDLV